MFSIEKHEQGTRSNLRLKLLATFADDDEVWELGSTRTLLIGDSSDMDEDDEADAEYKGTVAEYAASLDDA